MEIACAKIQKHEDICLGCTVLRAVIQSVHVETDRWEVCVGTRVPRALNAILKSWIFILKVIAFK